MTNERETEANPIQGGRNDRLPTQALLPTAVTEIAQLLAYVSKEASIAEKQASNCRLMRYHKKAEIHDSYARAMRKVLRRHRQIADAISASKA